MDVGRNGGVPEMQLDLSKGIGKTGGEIFLSLVSIFYVTYNAIWFLPDSSFKTTLLQPVRMWWNFWGFNQQWSLFSAGLSRYNLHTIMTLTFADGTTMLWEPPRMERMDLWDAFRLQKWRKWDVDYLPWDRYKEYYPDVARYVARLNYNPRNKPTMFQMHLCSTEIPAIDQEFIKRTQLPEHTTYSTIFVYKFSDRDCQ